MELFGRDGFAVGVRTIAKSAGVSPGLVIHHFGSKEGLRTACDDFVADIIRTAKTESIQTSDPATWLAQMAEIEDYAPIMAYLVRSIQTGGELAKMLWRRMIDNTEQYIEAGVRAGTIKPSADPKARARFLGVTGGGAFLLYLQLHDDPGDLRAVLRDYSQEMVLPALELYTNGLMTDSTIYDAFLAQREDPASHPTTSVDDESEHDHEC